MILMRPFAALLAVGFLSLPLVASAQAATPPIPKLEGRVNDYAHVLSPQQKAQLESFLKNQEDKTSNQIVVLTVPTLEGDTIEDFAVRVFKAWKLGQKGKDNGVLLVAAIQNRKMRIEVGFGLEGALTDAISSQIIRNVIGPRFKAGDYGGGLLAGVTAIEKAIRGEFKADKKIPNVNAGSLLLFLLFGLVFLALYVRMTRYARRQSGVPWWYTGSPSSWTGYSGDSGGGSSGGGGGFSGGGGGSGGGGASGGW